MNILKLSLYELVTRQKSVIPALGDKDTRIPGAHQPASLTKWLCSRISKGPSLKKYSGEHL